MNNLITTDVKMTSLDIAEVTGKKHQHVMRDIRLEIEELGEEVSQSIFGQSTYINGRGREYPCYEFGKDGAMQLALKYDAKTRYRVIQYIKELESNADKPSYMIDDPVKRAEQWIIEYKEKQTLIEQNEKLKPKALFAEAVETSKSSILVGELAKIIKQNGVNIGQNRLFEWLRENGFLIRKKGESYNLPTQRSMEQGLFEIKKNTINNPDGSIRTTRTPKVTGKGQIYFVKKFLGDAS